MKIFKMIRGFYLNGEEVLNEAKYNISCRGLISLLLNQKVHILFAIKEIAVKLARNFFRKLLPCFRILRQEDTQENGLSSFTPGTKNLQ